MSDHTPPVADRAPSRDPRPVARLLVDAVQQVPGQPYPWHEIDPELLLRAALQHGVAPAVALALRQREDAPEDLRRRFNGCYRDQRARHVRTMADLTRVTQWLNDGGFTWAVMKGPAIAETIWPRSDMRLYVDLDLVVDRHQMRSVLEMLREHSTTLVDRNWPMIAEQMRGEISLALPYGTPLDLHWHVVNDVELRRAFPFEMSELFARSSPTRLGAVTAPVFEATDTVLYLAYHMAHSGGHKLVWLKDFELAASRPEVDWDAVRERAARFGVELALEVVLRRTQRVLRPEGWPIPRPGRTAWGLLASTADRWRTPPHLPNERGSGRIVFQSTRASTGSSLGAAWDAAIHRPEATDLPRGQNPLHEDVDVPAAREAYLAALEGTATP